MTSEAEAAMTSQPSFDMFMQDVAEAAAARLATAQASLRELTGHFDRTATLETPGKALHALATAMGQPICDCSCMLDDAARPVLDQAEAELALSASQRGAIADTLHHLERALPEGYGEIAERLARHVERSAP
jgi:phosphoglycerate-specific signal transduction histidine kinase